MTKIGRNDLCSCGSGKKYKRCCWLVQQKRGRRGRPFKATVLTRSAVSQLPQGEASALQKELPDLIARTHGQMGGEMEEDPLSSPEQGDDSKLA